MTAAAGTWREQCVVDEETTLWPHHGDSRRKATRTSPIPSEKETIL